MAVPLFVAASGRQRRASRRHRIVFGLSAGWRGMTFGVSGIALWRKDRRLATDRLIAMADQIGRLASLFGYRVQEYRNHP